LALQFHLSTLDFETFLELGVPRFRCTFCHDAFEAEFSLDSDFLAGKFGVGSCLLSFSLCLEDGSGGVDLGDLLLRSTVLLGFPDVSLSSGTCDIDLGLVGSSFVCFSGKVRKVLAS